MYNGTFYILECEKLYDRIRPKIHLCTHSNVHADQLRFEAADQLSSAIATKVTKPTSPPQPEVKDTCHVKQTTMAFTGRLATIVGGLGA